MEVVFDLGMSPMDVRGTDVYDNGIYVGSFFYEQNDVLYDAIQYRDARNKFAGALVGFKGLQEESADFRDRDGKLSDFYVRRLSVYNGNEEIGRFETLAHAGAWIALCHERHFGAQLRVSKRPSNEPSTSAWKSYGQLAKELVSMPAKIKGAYSEGLNIAAEAALGEIEAERRETVVSGIFKMARPGKIWRLKKAVAAGELTPAQAAAKALESVKAYRAVAAADNGSGMLALELRRDFGAGASAVGERIAGNAALGPVARRVSMAIAEMDAGPKLRLVTAGDIKRLLIAVTMVVVAVSMGIWSKSIDGRLLRPLASIASMGVAGATVYVGSFITAFVKAAALCQIAINKAKGAAGSAISPASYIAGACAFGCMAWAIDFIIRYYT